MKRLTVILAFLSAILVSTNCYADTGNVHGLYEYDGEAIDGVEVELYKVADYNGNTGEFEFTEPYIGLEQDIGNMTNSELGDYGEELAQIETTPLLNLQTSSGEYGFTGLAEGIYLVTFKDITIGDYTYMALPIVLTMPDSNLNYQIELTTKLEKSCPDCIEPRPRPPEPEPPKPEPDKSEQVDTRDRIKKYINAFTVLIIVEALMLYAIIKQRKKGQNEKN